MAIDKTLWRLSKVRDRTGLSRSSIYGKMSTGEFPLNIKLGPRAVAWDADEVNDWIIKRIENSRRDD
jgi:prophage regulatory protein